MRPEISLLDEVSALAMRDIAREQTDFLGRMAQCLGAYEAIFDDAPDGNLSGEQWDDAVEEITGLCALALAQLAMLRFPEDPAALLCSASLPEPQLGVERADAMVEAALQGCRVCGRQIQSCELCDDCARGNDPFVTSKHSEGRP